MNKLKQDKNKFNNGAAALFAGLLSIAVFAPRGLEAQTLTFVESRIPVGDNLRTPNGVAVDRSGNIYIADTGNSRVVKIAADGTQTAVGTGWTTPVGVGVDAVGNVFVSDSSKGALVLVGTDGKQNALITGLKRAAGVAVRGDGTVYVADAGTNQVWMHPVGGNPKSLGWNWHLPQGVAADSAGNVYIADQSSVTWLATDGTITPLGGSWTQPTGLAVDSDKNVFVTSQGAGTVEKVTFSGTRTTVSSGWQHPKSVAVDAAGNLFIADTDLASVQEVQTAGADFSSVNICPAARQLTASGQPCTKTMAMKYSVAVGRVAGEIQQIEVLTQGAPDLDFTSTGYTCAVDNSYCTVNLAFSPRYPGLRRGAVKITDWRGLVMTTYIHGVGRGPQIGFGPVQATPVGSNWVSPYGIAVDGTGTVFVSDSGAGAHGIFKVSAGRETLAMQPTKVKSAPWVTTLDALGNSSSTWLDFWAVAVDGAGGLFPNRMLPAETGGDTNTGYPLGLAVDGAGGVFETDRTHNIIYKYAPGMPATLYHHTSTLGMGAGLAVDGDDNLFVAIPATPGGVTVITPDGSESSINDSLTSAWAIALDAAGAKFITDGSDIWRIAPSTTAPFSTSTTPTVFAKLIWPRSVTVDDAGDLYVTDAGDEILGPASVVKLQRSLPPALGFRSMVRELAPPNTVTIENTGNAPLAIESVAMGAGFVQLGGAGSADCQFPVNLAPGQACSLQIAFLPTSAGPVQSTAILTDNSLNATGTTHSIQLVGTGVGATTTVLTAASNSVTQGSADMLTATVSGLVGVSDAADAVVFSADGQTLCTSAITRMGTATCNFVPQKFGRVAVTAQFQGDSYHSGSSGTVTLTVAPATTH